FFSFIEEKKNQKEELSGSLGCFDLCGGRPGRCPWTLPPFGKGGRKLLPYLRQPAFFDTYSSSS
ncbi:MAG: hypothetical protein II889_02610, partial [Clostridia bacterium]|nr:hypothetical protein [Clostridia bacterium]